MKRPDAITWTAVALAAVLVVFAVGPILALASRGVADTNVLLGELRDPGARNAVWATLRTSLGATFVAVVLGVPIAFLLERTNLPARRMFALAFTSLIALPPFILGMGWIQLANPIAGYLNRHGAWVDIYGAPGIAFVTGTSGLPLVMLAAQAALARVDSSLEDMHTYTAPSTARRRLPMAACRNASKPEPRLSFWIDAPSEPW